MSALTKVDRVVEAAMELTDEERRQAAGRILQLVVPHDAELEASIALGIADLRAGRVIAGDEVLAELEAADRADDAAGL